VKSVCVQSCDDPADAVWKTTLAMTEGWGGNGLFMLDVTNPLPASGPPFHLLWSSSASNRASSYASALGLTVSVPAFTFIPGAGMNDHRLLLASGYPVDESSSTQGRSLVSASVQDGRLMTEQRITPSGGACPQEYTLLTDVATARLHMRDASGTANGRKQLLAGYFGDTWGNLWRYSPASGGTQLVSAFGCDHPLHFSPTVVQLDADDPTNGNAGQVYLVQVTNSTLDRETEGYPASRMVILKEVVNGAGTPSIDSSFGSNGQVVLTGSNPRQLCAVSNISGDSCLTALPATARPLATPTGLIKPDGTGFVLLSNWYVPAGDGCGKGATYLQIHDVSGSTVSLKQALRIADEPVVNPIIVNGLLMISASGGPLAVGGGVTLKVESATQPLSNVGDPFQLSNWVEIF
jgi:hypothetical protein